MKIDEIKKKYKNQWVLIEVTKQDELNRPLEGDVMINSKDRDEIYDGLDGVEDNKHVATFYTGEIPKKGYAVAFYGKKCI